MEVNCTICRIYAKIFESVELISKADESILEVVHMHWFLFNTRFMVHLNYALELCWCDVR